MSKDDKTENGSPLANGANGRDSAGQFVGGNTFACGRGNPHAAQVTRWHGALVNTVTPEDLVVIFKKLVEQAKDGKAWAVKELLSRCLGKVPAAVDVEAGGVRVEQAVVDAATARCIAKHPAS